MNRIFGHELMEENMAIKELYKHQKKYAKGYKDKELVVHEGGTGKTVCACVWLKDGRDSNALVVCPKRVVKKWEAELVKWGAKANVVSKEDFKKLDPTKYSALVIDEADEFASPLFTKQRSQLSTALYEQVKFYPDVPILLLTATPIRSNPWNLHTLLVFKGHYIDWKKWRDHFFSLERRPYLPRPAWIPKPNWRSEVRKVLEKYSDIVLLKDCVGELPPKIEEVINVKPKGEFILEPEWEEPAKIFVEKHKWEQNDKVKHILKEAKDFRKVIVVAYYVPEVERLAEELSKHRETFMVHGQTKDQEATLQHANSDNVDECFLVVQGSLGVGWDGDSFSQVIYTSMSYKVRDYVQMGYRVRRIHNLNPIKMTFLIGGKCDKAVYDTIQLGKDFVPSEYAS